MAQDLADLSLVEALGSIEAGTCQAGDIVESCLDRIEALEPRVRAWQHRPDRKAFMAGWRSRQASHGQSPLKGLLVGVKDIMDTTEFPTERGSSIYRGRMATADASCVALLRWAGAEFPGKTVTTEFAYFQPGQTTNPHRQTHTPGGSSSGSAAAVACGMVPVALGSQTAGSTIRPASYCGVVGFVPSHGLHALRGVMPLSPSFDTLGMLTRSVADAALIHRLLLDGRSDGRPDTCRPRRILLMSGEQFGEVSPSMTSAMETVADRLKEHEVEIVQTDRLACMDDAVATHERIMAFEAARTLASEYASRRSELGPQLLQLLEVGQAMGLEEYLHLLERRDGMIRTYAEAVAGFDGIAAPAAPDAAPRGTDFTGSAHMSRPWQLIGVPQIALPGLRDPNEMPLGVQLIGLTRQDERLLGLAAWFELKVFSVKA
ncbi:amidase [Rhodoligotrophos defluvii]|uniref:amidase n=1 Tax=Rhodoligotrophos defluvii TaxID=2561934 RepID=UPI0010C9524A|nr:amidase [Rhodoligotrophos defluvii]